MNNCENEIWLGEPHNYFVNCGFKAVEEDGGEIILCSECVCSELNIKLHTGHVRHLDLCENCVKILGRDKVKILLKDVLGRLSDG